MRRALALIDKKDLRIEIEAQELCLTDATPSSAPSKNEWHKDQFNSLALEGEGARRAGEGEHHPACQTARS